MSLPIKPELLLDKQKIGDQITVILRENQADLIPERTYDRVHVCSVYSALVGLWNT